MTDDEIFDCFDRKINEENCLDFINHLIREKPDTELNLVEMFESSAEFSEPNIGAIVDFADKMRSLIPEKYRNEYEFLELKLIMHAFDTDDEELVNRCLIKKCLKTLRCSRWKS